MEEFKHILIENCGYNKDHLDQIEKCIRKVCLQKNDFLSNAGNVCSYIGFVESGILRSYIFKEDNEFNIDFYLPGSFVSSYTSFLSRLPAKTNIQALSDTKIYTISHSDYNNLLKKAVDWNILGKFIANTLFMKKCKREKSLLKDSAEERYKLLLETYPEIEQLVTQYHIASYLGIKPESLSRIKSLTYINK